MNLSVVIVTYNRKDLVIQSLKSFLLQKKADSANEYSCVIVDDGSTDGSEAAILDFLKENDDSLNRVIYSKIDNSERGAARNHGFRVAEKAFRPFWVLFLDGDDLLAPGSLDCFSMGITPASHREVVGISGRISVFSEFLPSERQIKKVTNGVNSIKFIKVDAAKKMISASSIFLGATCISSCFFKKSGGFSELRDMSGSEDWEFLCRLTSLAPMISSSHIATFYRLHENNTSVDRYRTSLNLAVESISRLIFSKPEWANEAESLEKQLCLHKDICWIGITAFKKSWPDAIEAWKDLFRKSKRDFFSILNFKILLRALYSLGSQICQRKRC